jgi:Exodeoxyribonuclease III (EC 3.1.11.2)
LSSSPGPLPDGATRIASWNVNSLRVRLPHVLDWLATAQPDLLGLQETKLVDAKFPQAEIEAAGYAVHFIGQPTYNGVAILVRQARFSQISDVMHHDARLPDDQRRLTALTVTEANTGLATRFICVYVPNGSEVGSDKYRYKLAWLDALKPASRRSWLPTQDLLWWATSTLPRSTSMSMIQQPGTRRSSAPRRSGRPLEGSLN